MEEDRSREVGKGEVEKREEEMREEIGAEDRSGGIGKGTRVLGD